MFQYLVLIILVSIYSLSSLAQEHNYKPADGYVPNQETAVKIAVAVWTPIYGKNEIENQAPYNVSLKNGIWTVTGSIPEAETTLDENGKKVIFVTVGGVALIQISKDDGRIIGVSHGQ